VKVLGIDPGTQRTGWGLAERTRGSLRGLAAGVIVLDPRAPLADRLEVVYARIAALIDEHAPDAIAVEDVFYAKFANAAISSGTCAAWCCSWPRKKTCH
jgi:crossover junction endodeoxyribonuclease RuvC